MWPDADAAEESREHGLQRGVRPRAVAHHRMRDDAEQVAQLEDVPPVPAVDADGRGSQARGWVDRARERVDQRGFSRAVRSKHGHALSVVDTKAEPVQGGDAIAQHRDVVEFDERIRHGSDHSLSHVPDSIRPATPGTCRDPDRRHTRRTSAGRTDERRPPIRRDRAACARTVCFQRAGSPYGPRVAYRGRLREIAWYGHRGRAGRLFAMSAAPEEASLPPRLSRRKALPP